MIGNVFTYSAKIVHDSWSQKFRGQLVDNYEMPKFVNNYITISYSIHLISVSANDHTTYLDIPGMTGISGPAESKNPSVFCSVSGILM